MGGKTVLDNQLIITVVPLDTMLLGSVLSATQNYVSQGYSFKRPTISTVSCIHCWVNIIVLNEAGFNNGRKSCPQ